MTARKLTQQQQQLQQPSFFITFLAWLLNAALDMAHWAAFHGERLLMDYRVLEWLEDFLMYSTRQPVAAVILGIVTVVCGIPIFVFACFAVISSFVTFIGFLFIEGTLLTLGFGLLLSFLLIFGCMAIGLFTAGAATYCGVKRVRHLIDGFWGHSSQPDANITTRVSECKAD